MGYSRRPHPVERGTGKRGRFPLRCRGDSRIALARRRNLIDRVLHTKPGKNRKPLAPPRMGVSGSGENRKSVPPCTRSSPSTAEGFFRLVAQSLNTGKTPAGRKASSKSLCDLEDARPYAFSPSTLFRYGKEWTPGAGRARSPADSSRHIDRRSPYKSSKISFRLASNSSWVMSC